MRRDSEKLFHQVEIRREFTFEREMYIKLNTRFAMSADGKVRKFRDSDAVRVHVKREIHNAV